MPHTTHVSRGGSCASCFLSRRGRPLSIVLYLSPLSVWLRATFIWWEASGSHDLCFPWESLSEAATRVMEAAGLSRDEAQTDICQAIADRAINIQGKLGEHQTKPISASNTVLQGGTLTSQRQSIRKTWIGSSRVR
jgi:hypothetical protein